jgi:hypothetical protein
MIRKARLGALLAAWLVAGCGGRRAEEPGGHDCTSLGQQSRAFLEAALSGEPAPFFLPDGLLVSALDCADPSPFVEGTREKQEKLAGTLVHLGEPGSFKLVPAEEDRKRFEPGDFVFGCRIVAPISVRDVQMSPVDEGQFFLSIHFARIGDEGCWWVVGF